VPHLTNSTATDIFSTNWGLTQTQLAHAINYRMTQYVQNQIGTSIYASSGITTMNLTVTTANAVAMVTQAMLISVNTASTTYWDGTDSVKTGSFTIWKRSAEALERYEARRKEEERILIEREVERQVASGKAELLLRRMLSSKQSAELDEHGHFLVTGKNGQMYRIHRGTHSNVAELCPETGAVRKTFCVVPKLRVPDQDAMLAQKLLLEVDPERFLRIAQRLD
jgi:hypothetical protein